MDAYALFAALKRVLDSAGVGEAAITAVVPRRRVSLRMKMAEIARKVRAHNAGLDFESLFESPWHRYDIVLTFLAMLELLRLERIRVAQKRALGEIKLYPVEVSGS
jgi:segregation and condensation protein A